MKKPLFIPFWVRAVTVVLVLTLALGFMVGERLKILTSGTEIVLKTKPVDPRDFFRGHYARLNFDISEIPKVANTPSMDFKRNDPVFLRLKRTSNGFWDVVYVYDHYPEQQPGSVIIRGTVKSTYSTKLRIRYGIERYFAPKAQALKLEGLTRKEIEVGVILRISPKGEAAISGLMIEGKKIHEEPLF